MDDAIPQRKRGRPRAKEQMSAVSTWIPARQHERLASIARRQGVSVSRAVKHAVFLFLKDDSSGTL
jgi:hypothetical protein